MGELQESGAELFDVNVAAIGAGLSVQAMRYGVGQGQAGGENDDEEEDEKA
jgi:hypothetical protein